MEHRPHLTSKCLGSIKAITTEEPPREIRLYTHKDCPIGDFKEEHPLVILDPYSSGQRVVCQACRRRFGRKVRKLLRDCDWLRFNLRDDQMPGARRDHIGFIVNGG